VGITLKLKASYGSDLLRPVNIEDSSGCKRTLSTPGVTVNVKKIKPTVKFYGKGSRRVVTLENEQAGLPLRLTGDGVLLRFYNDIRYSINLKIASHGGSNIAFWNVRNRVKLRGWSHLTITYESQKGVFMRFWRLVHPTTVNGW
jgi:hypothetical protein